MNPDDDLIPDDISGLAEWLIRKYETGTTEERISADISLRILKLFMDYIKEETNQQTNEPNNET